MTRARAAFVHAYGEEPTLLATAPGRVNLIGDHTDYQEGFVLPFALPFGVTVAAGPASDGCVSALAVDQAGQVDRFLADVRAHPVGGWRDHLRGAVAARLDAGLRVPSCRLAIAGDVPQGAGLSSSAAVGVALAAALDRLAGSVASPGKLARRARSAEVDFVGTSCGIMDQLVSARAHEDAALLIDCRSQDVTPIPMPSDWRTLVIDSGVERELVTSAYNARAAECAAAARAYGVSMLRDLEPVDVLAHPPGLGEVEWSRARHVVSENGRVLDAVRCLREGDLATMGSHMRASHRSLRIDFETSMPAIDRLAGIANGAITVGGARMTGGGFGGCVVALCYEIELSQLQEAVANEYRTPAGEPPRMWSVTPSSGLSVERRAVT